MCLRPVVEIKAPLLSTAAWAIIHRQFLTRLRRKDVMSDAHVPIDLLWCRLLEQRQRGLMCDPRRLDACIARYGGACAVSFITPAVVEPCRPSSLKPCPLHPLPEKEKLRAAYRFGALWRAGLMIYRSQSNWRPTRSLLSSTVHGPPGCWNQRSLRMGQENALRDWSADSLV